MFWQCLANLGLLLAYYLVNMMGGKGSHMMLLYRMFNLKVDL